VKTIWITGGSTGIGFATAKKFLDNNWKVIISARNNENLINAKNKLLNNSANKNLYLYQCDISKRDQVNKTIEAITKEIGNINIALLNAAAYSPNKNQNFSIDNKV